MTWNSPNTYLVSQMKYKSWRHIKKELVHLTGICHIRQSNAWYLLLRKIVSSYIYIFFFPETFSDNFVHYVQNAHNYVAYFYNPYSWGIIQNWSVHALLVISSLWSFQNSWLQLILGASYSLLCHTCYNVQFVSSSVVLGCTSPSLGANFAV